MKYSYSLFLLLGAYFLYQEGSTQACVVFLSLLVLLALLGFLVECCAKRDWLERYF